MAAEKNALLSSSKAYFVPDVVMNIVCYYNELASSWPIPQTYLAKYSLAQIRESVALELHALCSVFAPTTLSDTVGGSGSGQNVRGGGRGDEPAGIQGNRSGTGGQHVQNIKNDQGGRGGRGGQGGQGGRGCHPMTLLHPEGQRFQNIQPTIITIDTFVTPKKSQHQRSIVCQAARMFLLDPIVKDLQSKAYDPYEEIPLDSKNKTRMLFHGTHRSRLLRFQVNGINPEWRPNEMSSDRAFYVTNSIEQAVAHVLYDVQIGPICLPTKPYPIILENWTRQEMYLTQVAACSKPAFDFFSNNLTQILEEKRVENARAA
ncbi:hypothetical protein PILCRDRAFT_85270 [Piloderma croceum F 1598]|uniref:Uncharacterized protein n=1 Tax=Piloderma croceum (strain F 1598) TaxID=765440 RepID=A0A0C3CG78_PILCF|nr:hypothetical protein PILCRDRAFT_85270 [Piloderma croceum F 1598]